MKKFFVIFALLLVVAPSVSYTGIVEWMKGTTYLYGHEVSSSMSNGSALFWMTLPLVLTLIYTAVLFSTSTKKQLKKATI